MEEKKISLEQILQIVYRRQYNFSDEISEEEIDSEVWKRNEELQRGKKENATRGRIPLMANYVHERRKWLRKIVDALVEPGAFKGLCNKKNNYEFQNKDALADFFEAILSEQDNFAKLRKTIIKKEYEKIDVNTNAILRDWIDTLYKAGGKEPEDINKALNVFDSHFSMEYREVQEELEFVRYYLSPERISLYDIEDFKFFTDELKKLSHEAREREKIENLEI